MHVELKHDKLKHNQIGNRIEDLIENYLSPAIKQLNKKKKKKRKRSNINNNDYHQQQLQFMHNSNSSPLLFQSTPHHDKINNNNINNHSYSQSTSALLSSSAPSASSLLSEPGQVIDEMSDLSEKCGGCCRRFVISCFWFSLSFFFLFA